MATSDTAHARCNPDNRPPTLGGHFCNLTSAAVEDGANRATELNVRSAQVQFKAAYSTTEKAARTAMSCSVPRCSKPCVTTGAG